MKNFLWNRTTKEQYSKVKKMVPPQTPPKKKREPSRTETMSSNCMYSESEDYETPFVAAEKNSDQIIYEFGAPRDFEGRNCVKMHNCWSMCFDTKMPNQMELYGKLTVKRDLNSIFANTSLMKVDQSQFQQNYAYVPGSFSVDASSNILYQPFKYHDIEEESIARIYETGFGNRPTNLEEHRMSMISEEY